MGITVAIIPARGGSKGIPKKNLIGLCDAPLVVWSIRQALSCTAIHSVWVSSDSQEILDVAASAGAVPIVRPAEISGDEASSESAWLHALDVIESAGHTVDRIVGMQATSPLRTASDLTSALVQFQRDGLDSMLSCCEVEDFFIWEYDQDGRPVGVNHDYLNRQRRQLIKKRYLENGSFYIFTPEVLRTCRNRLGGKIGLFVMEKYKMFQIDNPQDVTLCEVIMRGYGLDK